MKPLVDGKMPPPPIDAWGAFFEYFDGEIAAGRETQESVRLIHERAHDLDWDAQMRKYQSMPLRFSTARDVFQEIADRIWAEIVLELQVSMQKNKTPFWSKKWRGQR